MENSREAILTYLKEITSDKYATIEYNVNIMEEGIINSLGIISLIDFIEKRFNIEMQDSDFEMSNFISVDAIASLVDKYRKEQP